MTREIKFRAWHLDEGVMHLDAVVFGGTSSTTPWAKNMVWMQFIGLADKNGKEIYEGDIVKVKLNYQTGKTPVERQKRRTYVVIWVSQRAEYQLQYPEDLDRSWGGACGINDVSEYEVIGNIYESPGLTNV